MFSRYYSTEWQLVDVAFGCALFSLIPASISFRHTRQRAPLQSLPHTANVCIRGRKMLQALQLEQLNTFSSQLMHWNRKFARHSYSVAKRTALHQMYKSSFVRNVHCLNRIFDMEPCVCRAKVKLKLHVLVDWMLCSFAVYLIYIAATKKTPKKMLVFSLISAHPKRCHFLLRAFCLFAFFVSVFSSFFPSVKKIFIRHQSSHYYRNDRALYAFRVCLDRNRLLLDAFCWQTNGTPPPPYSDMQFLFANIMRSQQ